MAYDKAKVTVKWSPGEYEKAVSAALLTSKVPDVFEYGNGPTLGMIKANQVLDLTDTIGDAKSQFSAPVIAPMIWEDKVWAIAQTVTCRCSTTANPCWTRRGSSSRPRWRS